MALPLSHLFEIQEKMERIQRPYAYVMEMQEKIGRFQKPYAHVMEMQERMAKFQKPFAHILEMQERMAEFQKPFAHILEMRERMAEFQKPFAHILEMRERMVKFQKPFAHLLEMQKGLTRIIERNPHDSIINDIEEFGNSIEAVNQLLQEDVQTIQLHNTISLAIEAIVTFIQKNKGKISKRTVDHFLNIVYGLFFYYMGSVSASKSDNILIKKIDNNFNSIEEQNKTLAEQVNNTNEKVDSLYALCTKLVNAISTIENESYPICVITDKCFVYKNPFSAKIMDRIIDGLEANIIDSSSKRYYISYTPLTNTLPRYGWVNKKYILKIRPNKKGKKKLYPIKKR